MSSLQLRLVKLVLAENFGDSVEGVASLLAKRGALPLSAIVSATQLPARTVKEALFILIQHNIVLYYRAEANGESSMMPILYHIRLSAVTERLLYPVFAAVARRFCGASEEDRESIHKVVLECAKNGRVTLQQLSSISRTATKSLFELGFLEMVNAASSTCSLGADDANADASLSSLRRANVSPSKRKRGAPGTSLSKNFRPPSPGGACSKRGKYEDLRVDESVAFARLAHTTFTAAIFQGLLVDFARRRINEAAGHVMQASLACVGISCSPSGASFSSFQVGSKLPIETKLLVDQPDSPTLAPQDRDASSIVKYLDAMAQDLKFFKKEDGRGHGLYSVNFAEALESIRMGVVESFIRARFGQASARLFCILKDRRVLEEKTISKVAMMTAKETRERLFELLKWGLVHLQEVPKTLDHAPARTFYLWTIPTPIAFARLADVSLKAWINLQERAALQRRKHQVLIVKSERSDVLANPNLLSEAEKNALRNLRKTLNRLLFNANQVAIEVAVLSLLSA